MLNKFKSCRCVFFLIEIDTHTPVALGTENVYVEIGANAIRIWRETKSKFR